MVFRASAKVTLIISLQSFCAVMSGTERFVYCSHIIYLLDAVPLLLGNVVVDDVDRIPAKVSPRNLLFFCQTADWEARQSIRPRDYVSFGRVRFWSVMLERRR